LPGSIPGLPFVALDRYLDAILAPVVARLAAEPWPMA
jgi:hypothetical protein